MSSSPTAKAAEKEHNINIANKKNNFSPVLWLIGQKEEWATNRSEIFSWWMSYPNSLMECCVCL